MAGEKWLIELEAFLDGELEGAQEAALRQQLQHDAGLRQALAERQGERGLYRQALRDGTQEPAPARPASHEMDNPFPRRRPVRWQTVGMGLALAAALGLFMLAPWKSRDIDGAEGPRSPFTMSGQVAAVRFGERPGATVILETGSADFTAVIGQRTEGL